MVLQDICDNDGLLFPLYSGQVLCKLFKSIKQVYSIWICESKYVKVNFGFCVLQFPSC